MSAYLEKTKRWSEQLASPLARTDVVEGHPESSTSATNVAVGVNERA